MQPGGERLLQADEEVPGQELAAVGVAAELEVEARGLGRGGAARLVREQDSQRRAGGLPASAARGSLAWSRSKWPALKSVTPATTSGASPRRTTTCSFISTATPSRRSSSTHASAPE